MMDQLPPKYKVATISISGDGKQYWIGYYGKHADQGGFTFRWGEIGFASLEGVLAVLKNNLEENMEFMQSVLKEKK